MDLPESTDVVLDIKSNLFRDVTKMTSNYTYTIQLPRTVHNLSVLQQADRPKSGSRYPFIFHQCSYFRGGVQIIKDGRLNVLSIEESIEDVAGILEGVDKKDRSDFINQCILKAMGRG